MAGQREKDEEWDELCLRSFVNAQCVINCRQLALLRRRQLTWRVLLLSLFAMREGTRGSSICFASSTHHQFLQTYPYTYLSVFRFINARRRIVQPMIDQSNRAGRSPVVNVFKNRRRKSSGQSPGPSPDCLVGAPNYSPENNSVGQMPAYAPHPADLYPRTMFHNPYAAAAAAAHSQFAGAPG
jgi:hypothetical protein